MKYSPQNTLNHELIGRQAHVVKSNDKNRISTQGVIRTETREILGIESGKKMVMVPKKDCVFDITLPDGSKVRVDGKLLQGRPEDRMKKRVRRSW
ncbi:ribonuclease P protein subunit [Candidatus Thorarchaeota archaeon]|nr:MAG: ribonuclease P protein subunit [Candidatus Thorarchaeota archaeon]